MLCNNRPTATEIRNIAVHQGNVHRLVLPQAFKTVHFIFFVKIMCALQKKKLQHAAANFDPFFYGCPHVQARKTIRPKW